MTNRGRSILLILFLVGFAVIVGSFAKCQDHFSSKKAYKKQGIMSPLAVELRDWTQTDSNWVTIDFLLTNHGREVVVGCTILYKYAYLNTQEKQTISCNANIVLSDLFVAPNGGQYSGSFHMVESREIEKILIWGVTEAVLE